MINKIEIDLNEYLAEDYVKLMYLRYRRERIFSMKINNSKIELTCVNESYTAPSKKIPKKNNIFRFFQNTISLVFRKFENQFIKLKELKKNESKIKFLYLIHRDDFVNYSDFISLINEINYSKKKSVVFLDWMPNQLEQFIIKDFRFKYSTKKFRISSNSKNYIADEMIFLADRLNLKIISSIKKDDKVVWLDISKEEVKKQKADSLKQKRDIVLIIDSKFPLDLDVKPIGFQDRAIWNPSLFGEFISENVKTPFLISDERNFSVENIEELIKFGINLISKEELNELNYKLRVNLPGLLLPFNPEIFNKMVIKAQNEVKCFRIKSNAVSYIHIHCCDFSDCNPQEVFDTNFYHYNGFYPRQFNQTQTNSNSKKRKICLVLPPYTRASGGIVAMYKLHDFLKQNGYEVYVLPYNPTGTFSFYSGLNILFQNQINFKLEDAVWIYSDTISSLPVDASIQIQWLMNRPGYLPATSTGTFRIRPSFVFKYSDVISSDIENKLFISNFNFDLFHPKTVKNRIGPSIYLGKKSKLQLSDIGKFLTGEFQIINRTFPLREDLPYLLSCSSILISLDTLSALNIEANLCGTPTLILTNSNSKFTEQDIRRFELPTLGLIYDLNEIDKVPSLDSEFHKYFKSEAEKLEKSNLENFLTFLEKI